MKFLWYLLILNLIAMPSWAQFSSWSSRQGPATLRQKQDNNYRDVWSLTDYFETQRKHRLMDQWLALNSSSNPFEFFLGAQTTTYDAIVTEGGVEGEPTEYRMSRAQFGAYASIIGLEAEYADSKENFTTAEGSINLRLLGRSTQGTNLTGFYGIRYKEDEGLTTSKEKFKQGFYGGSLTLNITRYVGIIGSYKKYAKEKSDINSELDGDRLEGTFFIDFRFVRVYGTYFNENETYTNVVTPTTKETERTGVFGGLKIFF